MLIDVNSAHGLFTNVDQSQIVHLFPMGVAESQNYGKPPTESLRKLLHRLTLRCAHKRWLQGVRALGSCPQGPAPCQAGVGARCAAWTRKK